MLKALSSQEDRYMMSARKIAKLFACCTIFICSTTPHVFAQDDKREINLPLSSLGGNSKTDEDETEEKKNPLLDTDFSKAPTFIKSDSLILKSEAKKFEYLGNVEVKQGNMLMTCDNLEGFYDDENQIQRLNAKRNVVITKGENIRATSESAVYLRKDETLTLTESPELLQEESVLTADLVRIFLKEDRSVAEGQVRVKLVKSEEEENQQPKSDAKQSATRSKSS